MGKIKMGPRMVLGPRPVFLVGANIDGKPNFMTAAACNIVCSKPPMVCVAITPKRYTLKGIQQNMTFSVNLPSTALATETDYCGITPGDKIDKVKVCQFEVFYGVLNNAPMVEQYPVNLECSVEHILNLGSHFLVIGKIEEAHISEDCLTDGKPDIDKVKPIMATREPDPWYVSVGQVLAKSYSVGKELKARE